MDNLFMAFSKYFKLLLKPSAFILLYLAVYLVVQVVVTIAYVIGFIVYMVVTNHSLNEITTEAILKNTTPALLISIILTLPAYFLISKIRKQDFFKICGLKKTGPLNIGLSSILGASMGVFIMLVLTYINYVFPLEKISSGYEELMEIVMSGNFIIVFITVGVMGPIVEEIIFRGLILSELKRVIPIQAAIIIQAFLFGAYHMNLLQGMYAFVIGIVLGLVMVKTRSLWTAIFVHIFFNSINVILNKVLVNVSEEQFESYQLLIFLSSFVLTALSFLFIWRLSNRGQVALAQEDIDPESLS